MADNNPNPIPTGYHGLVNPLQRYAVFLQHLVGARLAHYTEVRRVWIAVELNNHQHIFESLDARQIALLLWQIFMDARQFFLAGMDVQGNLPQSLLQTTYNRVVAGIVQAHLNVPYSELLGQDSGEASYSPETGAATGS
jgi:hypothetical protein